MPKIFATIFLLFMLGPIPSFNGLVLAQSRTAEELFARLTKDGPSRGSANAPVTLIEFSDFRCSFCRKFWQTTLPLLDKKYISTGKLRFIYRHFAVLGRPSEIAAQGAVCAGEQGKFWEYHDKLFANAGSALAFTDGKLKGYAKELGLNSQTFDHCLDSGKHLKKVEEETAIAALVGARGTPAFLLDRQLVVGAQPFEVFESLIAAKLKNSVSSEKMKP